MGFRDREDAVLALEMPDCAENLLAMTLSLDVSGQVVSRDWLELRVA
jgi:hypothetical protein